MEQWWNLQQGLRDTLKRPEESQLLRSIKECDILGHLAFQDAGTNAPFSLRLLSMEVQGKPCGRYTWR